MKKKFSSLIAVCIMLVFMLASTVSAQSNSTNTQAFTVNGVTLKNASGTVVQELTPNGSVDSVGVVKNTTGQGIVVTSLYKGNKLVSYKSANIPQDLTLNTSSVVPVKMPLPADVSGLTLKTSVWTSLDTAKPESATYEYAPVYKYCFSGSKADYKTIDNTTAYTSDLGYGFTTSPSAISYTNNTCSSTKSLEFRADVPHGNYNVTVKVTGTSVSSVDLMVNNVDFTGSPMNSSYKWVSSNGVSSSTFRFANIEDNMKFDFNLPSTSTSPVALSEITITPAEDKAAGTNPTIFLISDSTVCDYDANRLPITGWGTVLPRFLTPEIKVDNRAMGGRSTRTAYTEGRLNDLLVDVKPGDYVFIQFAHNDSGGAQYADRSVTVDQYIDYLTNDYIKGVKERGGIPVCVTSMNRRPSSSPATDSFPDYTAAMKKVAQDNNCPLLDLNAKSLVEYNALGVAGTQGIFMSFDKYASPFYATGYSDNTHFTEAGAKQNAKMICEEIKANIPALAPYVLDANNLLYDVCTDTLTSPYRSQIETIVYNKLMDTDRNRKFNPDRAVLVKDFATLVANVMKISPKDAGLDNMLTDYTPITREKAASIIYDAYVYKKGIKDTSVLGKTDLSVFTDKDDISSELKDKVAVVDNLCILRPSASFKYGPQNSLTKSDVACVLYYLNLLFNI